MTADPNSGAGPATEVGGVEDERDDGAADANEDVTGLIPILDLLHRSRGFDFTGYKQASIARRIRRRMQLVKIPTFAAYLDHLQVHPEEFPQLFDMLLINVTAFFRDPAAWESIAARAVEMFADDGPDAPIRVWSAGCSSGEEPYTLAITLAEALGLETFVRRVKIYATDLDDDALAQARQASYTRKALEPISPVLVEKYFTPLGSQHLVFNKEMRRAVIFGRHDLVQDAPIPRIDLLACRNILMYFNAETQTKILQRLHFALNPRGLLVLGKAEMLLTHADLFTPADLKLRLFGRAQKSGSSRDRIAPDPARLVKTEPDVLRARLKAATFESSSTAQIVVDSSGTLALINRRAAHLFALPASEVGRPFQDLELSYRPAELRSCIEKVKLERRGVHLREVERSLAGEKAYLDIDVMPLLSETGVYLGAQVTFTDVTHGHRLQLDLRRTNADLETAHEELQSASEELETTNEELQSTVEELETTNEELQSTNEELETMNEELQAANEELQTINGELRLRDSEMNAANSFHGAVLGSLPTGVAVLDGELRVRTWNDEMTELWGVTSAEVLAKHFLNLDIGLPFEPLTNALRACLGDGGATVITVECTNRRGKPITCDVRVMPLQSDQEKGAVIVISKRGDE